MKSTLVSTAPGKCSQKLGHPVPLSNFLDELNKGKSHPAQLNVPSRFSSLSKLEKGLSVPSSLKTLYEEGESLVLHSASVRAHSSSLALEAAKTAWDLVKIPKKPVKRPMRIERLLQNKEFCDIREIISYKGFLEKTKESWELN